MQNSLEIELPVYVICGACNNAVCQNEIYDNCDKCGAPLHCGVCECESISEHLKQIVRDRYYALDERYVLVRKISHFPIWCRKTILTFLRNL